MLVLIVLLIAAVIFLAVLFAIPMLVLPKVLGKRYSLKEFDSADYGIASERIGLKTDDGLNLVAWRTKSAVDAVKGTVIIIAGLEGPSATEFFGMAKMLADYGWDALLIEMRARGLSEGTTIGVGMTEWRDVKAGVDFLALDERAKPLPIAAMGTSMGGATVIIAAGEIPRINAVIALSAFSSFSSMIADVVPMFGVPKFLGRLSVPFFNIITGFYLGFGVMKYTPMNALARLGSRPLLLMHSTGDTQVPFSQYKKILSAARSQGVKVTEFIREGDEHFVCSYEGLKDPAADTEFCRAIADFLNDC